MKTVLRIKICRECKASHHRSIKNAKNAFLENPQNGAEALKKSNPDDVTVFEDYVHRNIIKKPENVGGIARMAVAISSQWQNGRTLTVSFLEGNKVVKERIKKHAKEWMKYANIELDFRIRKKPADIRISFDMNDGSWSFVGTDSITVPTDEPTMNYGWLRPKTSDEEYHRTVLHEFGHALGCIHEHQNNNGSIPWDKPKAYKYYAQQGWTKEEVDEQVFAKYDADSIRGTVVDKKSIMMYPIPTTITIGNYAVAWNSDLSEHDKSFIGTMYPKK